MKNTIKLWLVLIILTFTHGVMANTQHTLRPGDVLSLKFPGEAEFNQSFQLDPQGYILLPEIGGVFLEGPDPQIEIVKTQEALVL